MLRFFSGENLLKTDGPVGPNSVGETSGLGSPSFG